MKLVSQGRWSMLREKKKKSKFKGLHPEPTWKLVSGVTVQCPVFCRMEEYFPASTRGHGEWVNGLGEFGVRDVGNELSRLFWSSQFRLKQTNKQKKPPDPTASAEVWSDSIFRTSSHSGKMNRTGLGLCVKKQPSDRTVSNCWPTEATFESVARNENSEALCFWTSTHSALRSSCLWRSLHVSSAQHHPPDWKVLCGWQGFFRPSSLSLVRLRQQANSFHQCTNGSRKHTQYI